MAVLLLDACVAIVGALVLWHNGGENVVSGPVAGILLFWLIVVGLVVARALLAGRLTAGQRSGIGSCGERCVVSGDTLGVVVLVVSWQFSQQYLLGWAALFSSLVLFFGSSLQLFLDVLLGRNERSSSVRNGHRPSLLTSVEMFRFVGGAVGLIVVAVTWPIHLWSSALLNPLALLVLSAFGAGTLVRLAGVAVRRRARRSLPALVDAHTGTALFLQGDERPAGAIEQSRDQ